MRVILIILILLPMYVRAADINCRGLVVVAMDYPQKCSGGMAFKTASSNGSWICPPSKNGNSIVLTALTAGKEVSVYIDSQGDTITCSALPQYTPARYVIIYP